ncbi:MAG: hypothetical protein AAFO89_02415 [Planctomycetota bacterium]
MKPATVSITSIAGTLGVVAAIGFAQPDGLQPPAGPVDDTQPSLATISQQIDALGGIGAFPPDLQFAFGSVGGGSSPPVFEAVPASVADEVRLYGLFVTSGNTNLLVGPNETRVAGVGGSTVNSNNSLRGSTQFQFGGLRVPTPVKFSTGPENGSGVTLLYWIEEEDQ